MNLIHGNCQEHLASLAAGSIDLTVTSPPYDDLRTYNSNNVQWGQHVWQDVLTQLYRVTKEGGTVVWIVADKTEDGTESGTSFRQALWAMEQGFNLHDTMIWQKPSFTATGSLVVRYASVFDYMFIFSKGHLETFNPIKDRVNLPGKLHGKPRQKDGSFKKINNPGQRIKPYGQRFNVWEMPGVLSNTERMGHPAPFPFNLARDHIKSWSNPGDTILDPFMGSGTTGLACHRLGRKFVGIELDPTYYNIAKTRIEEAQAQGELFQDIPSQPDIFQKDETP